MGDTENMEVTKERVVRELAAIAFANAADHLQVVNGQLQVADMPAGRVCAAIQSVEKTSSGLRVKFYDKLKALELLGKSLGLFEGTADAGQNNLLEAILAATRKEQSDDLQTIFPQAGNGHDLVE